MDYAAHYAKLMRRAKERTLPEGTYTERHHVFPRRLGGSNNPSNLILLTPEEHFIAHLLLVKIFPDSKAMVTAAFLMRSKVRGNKSYGWLRRAYVMARQQFMTGSENHRYGVPMSEETKIKIGEANRGRIRSAETKAKMSAAHKNRPKRTGHKMSPERVEKLRGEMTGAGNPMFGRRHTEETKRKISEKGKGRPGPRLGVKLSPEIKEKLRQAALNRAKRKHEIDNG